MDNILENGKNRFMLSVIKGTIISLCLAMVFIIIFAFIVKLASLSEGMIKPINQIIKIVSIFFGVLGACKLSCHKFFFKGLLVGCLFAVISFLLFSMLNNFSFVFDMSVVWDILFGTLLGGVCSVIVYYIKK